MNYRDDSNQWLNDVQVERITGRRRQTLRNDRCKGVGIPYSKLGRLVRYSLADVMEFMKGNRIETRPL